MLLLRYVPERHEQLVHYVGWYSNRARGERAKAGNARDAPNPCAASAEIVSEFAQRAKAAWARLIRTVYAADPLQCPKCKGPMRVIALIEDPGDILEHLGLWVPEAPERGPPGQANASIAIGRNCAPRDACSGCSKSASSIAS